jgi:hypothetical protein
MPQILRGVPTIHIMYFQIIDIQHSNQLHSSTRTKLLTENSNQSVRCVDSDLVAFKLYLRMIFCRNCAESIHLFMLFGQRLLAFKGHQGPNSLHTWLLLTWDLILLRGRNPKIPRTWGCGVSHTLEVRPEFHSSFWVADLFIRGPGIKRIAFD